MVQSASDVLEICQAKYSYAYTIDGRDWDGHRELLTDEVVVDFRGLGFQGAPKRRSADSWVAIVRGQIDGFAMTQHVVSAPVVRFLGPDEAELTTYLQAHHVLNQDDPPEHHYTIAGRYEDRLSRVDGRWLFSALTLHGMWTRGDASVMSKAAQRPARDTP